MLYFLVIQQTRVSYSAYTEDTTQSVCSDDLFQNITQGLGKDLATGVPQGSVLGHISSQSTHNLNITDDISTCLTGLKLDIGWSRHMRSGV